MGGFTSAISGGTIGGSTAPQMTIENNGGQAGLAIDSDSGVSVGFITIDSASGDTLYQFRQGGTTQFTTMHDASASEYQIRDGTASGVVIIAIGDGTGDIGFGAFAEGGTARRNFKTAHEDHTLSLAATSDTTMSIPSGARLLGASFNVEVAVTDSAGDDTWSAAFITGSTATLATAAAAAQNTKVDTLIADEIASATTEVQFTPNGGNFTAGQIEVVVYYEDFTSLANV